MATVVFALYVALLTLEAVALVDAAMRKSAAFVAADKQTKKFWLILLGVGTLATLYFGPFGTFLLGLVGVVAASVYLLDVRPAVRGVGGGRGGGQQHMGPYGPW